MSKNKTKPEDHILVGLFYKPFLAINDAIYRRLNEAGYSDLRPAHFSVFQHLSPEGSRATEMADRAQITKQSMGYLVDILDRQGYVEQVPDPTDGRARIVRLTERGKAVNRVAEEVLQELEVEWARELGKNKMHKLRDLLSDLAEIINSNR